MAIALSIGILILIAFLIWRGDHSPYKKYFWLIMTYRLLLGLLLGYLYSEYYGDGDTFSVFRDATTLSSAARHDSFGYISFLWSGGEGSSLWAGLSNHQHRSLFMIEWVSVVNLITGDNYWVTSLYFSLFSFLGGWYLVRVVTNLWPASSSVAVFSFLVYPSVVFWSSGVTKEAVALPCLFILSGIFLIFWNSGRLPWRHWIIIFIAGWICWRLKYYYAGIFFSVTGTTLIVKTLQTKFKLMRMGISLLLWVTVFAFLTGGITILHPNFDPEELPRVIVDNYEAFAKLSDPHKMILYPDLKPTLLGLLQYTPKAFFSGLFRPFIWEADSWIVILSAIENTSLILLFLTAIVSYKQFDLGVDTLLTLAVMTYIILLGVLLPLSTPNFGTLSRYRVGYLPFFVFLVACRNPVFARILKIIERLYSHFVRKR
jgi:hypothetical protein